MATVEVSLEDVTVCAPCDPNGEHPESHAEGARCLMTASFPDDERDDLAVSALAYAARKHSGGTGPVTVHKCPYSHISGTVTRDGREIGIRSREWYVTRP